MDTNTIRGLLNDLEDAMHAAKTAKLAVDIAKLKINRLREESPEDFDKIVEGIEAGRKKATKATKASSSEETEG